jgi:hypothetical protein
MRPVDLDLSNLNTSAYVFSLVRRTVVSTFLAMSVSYITDQLPLRGKIPSQTQPSYL